MQRSCQVGGWRSTQHFVPIAPVHDGSAVLLTPQVEAIEDTVQAQLAAIAGGQEVDKAAGDALKKRKLAAPEAWTTFRLTKGPKFALERKKQPTDLTTEMLQK